jgi:hypothetical protein
VPAEKKKEAKFTIMGVRVKRQCFTGGECVHMKKTSSLSNWPMWGSSKRGKCFYFYLKKQIDQFDVTFILLHHGCPMSDLPSMIEVLHFLCVPHCPQKHWSISIGWGMAICLNEVVLAKTLSLMHKIKYMSISCDKVH